MAEPKILVVAGSIRTGSHNARLAALAVKELALIDADVTRLSLADYPMPIYDRDLEAESGPPENALKLKRQISNHHGVLLVSPEYNASVTPLLKNAIDWVSRVRDRGEPPLPAYKNRAFAVCGASNGRFGAMRSILAMRQVLEIGCGALVIPEYLALAGAGQAFDDRDNLRDDALAEQLRNVLRRLIETAQHFVDA